MRNYYIISIAVIYIILGCTKGDQSQKIGYLVTPSKSDIYYKCGDKEATLDRNGKFICSSFPITFYLEGNEMGIINSIHNDKYVLPQDIEKITIASRRKRFKSLVTIKSSISPL